MLGIVSDFQSRSCISNGYSIYPMVCNNSLMSNHIPAWPSYIAIISQVYIPLHTHTYIYVCSHCITCKWDGLLLLLQHSNIIPIINLRKTLIFPTEIPWPPPATWALCHHQAQPQPLLRPLGDFKRNYPGKRPQTVWGKWENKAF